VTEDDAGTCGCCEGVKKQKPLSIVNRSGLSDLSYRVGTHSKFKGSMIAALSNSASLPEGCTLLNLATRADDDLSIALLDAWATVSDVLTFYQERIANEGFLRTATERRSIVELARSVGYELRPGVAASAYLAFTIEDAPGVIDSTVIEAGTKVQSLPIQGKMPPEVPQTFETIEKITAYPELNSLKPKLTKLQLDDEFLNSTDAEDKLNGLTSLVFKGTDTQLKVGDGLLIAATKEGSIKPLRFKIVSEVSANNVQQFTTATLCPEKGTLEDYAYTQTETAVVGTYSLVAESKERMRVSQIGAVELEKMFSQQIELPQLKARVAERGWASRDFVKAANSITKANVPKTCAKVFAFQVKAGFFGCNAQPYNTLAWVTNPTHNPGNPYPYSWEDRSVNTDSQGKPNDDGKTVLLDNAYLNVAPRGWVVLRSKDKTAAFTAAAVFEKNAADYMMASKVTGLSLNCPETGPYVVLQVLEVDSSKQWITKFQVTGYGFLNVPRVRLIISTNDTVHNYGPYPGPLAGAQPGFFIIKCVAANTTDQLKEGVGVHVAGIDDNGADVGINVDAVFGVKDVPMDSRVAPLAKFKVRETTAFIRPKELDLAEIIDKDQVIKESMVFYKLVDGLEVEQPIAFTGELSNQQGIIASEVALIKDVGIDETGPRTRITFTKLVNSYNTQTLTINANVAAATHGETKNEILGSGDPSNPHLEFKLRQKPLTYVAATTPEGATSTLELRVDDILWSEVSSLYGVSPNDRSYVARIEDDGQTRILFGNAKPNIGVENVTAKYRVGLGADGIVKAGQLSLLLTRPLGVRSVTNPEDSSGAADPEKLYQARKNAPLRVLTLDRIVSAQDCENFALTYAGIGKARAMTVLSGEQKWVRLIVGGSDGKPVNLRPDMLGAKLIGAIKNYCDPLMQVKLETFNPKLFALKGTVWITNDSPDLMQSAIAEALQTEFSYQRHQFGQKIARSEVVAVIQGVDGVVGVDLDCLCLSSESESDVGDCLPCNDSELLMLDPDPAAVRLKVMQA
jgi:hypothetical protein